jgi:hypothetical protein
VDAEETTLAADWTQFRRDMKCGNLSIGLIGYDCILRSAHAIINIVSYTLDSLVYFVQVRQDLCRLTL